MEGPNHFIDSIFELASFLTVRTSTLTPPSNLTVHLSRVKGRIHDALTVEITCYLVPRLQLFR